MSTEKKWRVLLFCSGVPSDKDCWLMSVKGADY